MIDLVTIEESSYESSVYNIRCLLCHCHRRCYLFLTNYFSLVCLATQGLSCFLFPRFSFSAKFCAQSSDSFDANVRCEDSENCYSLFLVVQAAVLSSCQFLLR